MPTNETTDNDNIFEGGGETDPCRPLDDVVAPYTDAEVMDMIDPQCMVRGRETNDLDLGGIEARFQHARDTFDLGCECAMCLALADIPRLARALRDRDARHAAEREADQRRIAELGEVLQRAADVIDEVAAEDLKLHRRIGYWNTIGGYGVKVSGWITRVLMDELTAADRAALGMPETAGEQGGANVPSN